MARYYDIQIDIGTDFEITLPEIKDFKGDPVTISSGAVEAAMRRSHYQVDKVIINSEIVSNRIRLSMPASVTANLFSANWVYQVALTLSGKTFIVYNGLAVVNPGVVNTSNNNVKVITDRDKWEKFLGGA